MADPSPAMAEAIVGAPGEPTGVVGADAADDGPVPALFIAVTVNVYETPFVSPVTWIGLAPPVAVIAAGFDVTV